MDERDRYLIASGRPPHFATDNHNQVSGGLWWGAVRVLSREECAAEVAAKNADLRINILKRLFVIG